MPNVALEPLLYPTLGRTPNHKIHTKLVKSKSFSLNCSLKSVKFGGSISSFLKPSVFPLLTPCSATTTTTASDTQTAESTDIVYSKTFPLHRIETIEGKIFIRLDQGKDGNNRQLSVGCSLPGNWLLHWGVYYVGDSGSEWDQPPVEMRPPGSICIKDYAIETPLLDVSEGGERLYEVKIDVNCKSEIAAIIFVLKDEETGSWYQHKGKDFKVPLVDRFQDGDCVVGARSGFNLFTKATRQVYNVFVKEERRPKAQDSSKISAEGSQPNRLSEGIYYEQHVVKNVPVDNLVTVSVRRCPETAKNLLHMETDLSGDVVVHWGVCRDSTKKWEVPNAPYPADTGVFKNKALRTRLQPKKDGNGHTGFFTLDQGSAAFAFVLKLNNETWLNCMGNDFFIPLSTPSSADVPSQNDQYEDEGRNDTLGMRSSSSDVVEEAIEQNQEVSTDHTDGIIHEIRSLVSDLSSNKKWKIKSKEVQERILHEIEKLAAEAYSIFRISVPTFTEESISETEEEQPPVKIASGTGSGFEILCQGFNWESHKSRSWYMELHERAEELSTIGFTIIWLPPPTDSVSPEGYMPRDLYNLNSRYGTIDELKTLVKKFHEAGLKVLGDVVLNHRCAHHQNKNGIWNIFGGRLNWDDRAIVADDPHFQVYDCFGLMTESSSLASNFFLCYGIFELDNT